MHLGKNNRNFEYDNPDKPNYTQRKISVTTCEKNLGLLALNAIEKGMSFREADTLFGIPYGTLSKRYRGLTTCKIGAATTLSATVEKLIVKLIMFMADIGFGLNKFDILSIVSNYLKESDQSNLFTNCIPSNEWYSGFLKRNPMLAQRCASSMQKNRCIATQASVLNEWFNK
jgi:hypothetical protein